MDCWLKLAVGFFLYLISGSTVNFPLLDCCHIHACLPLPPPDVDNDQASLLVTSRTKGDWTKDAEEFHK